MPPRLTKRKGETSASPRDGNVHLERLSAQVNSLQQQLQRLLSPAPPQGGFNLRGIEVAASQAERSRALHYMWARRYDDVFCEILDSNPDLAELLISRTANRYNSRLDFEEEGQARRARRINFLGGLLARNRNQNFLPKHQLLFAIQCKHKQLNQSLWAQMCYMRLVPSLTWTGDFIAEALELESEYIPSYEVVDWVSASVFDNYTEQVNYSAAHNADSQGERLDMTNWATLYLPRSVLPHINLGTLGGAGNGTRAIPKSSSQSSAFVPFLHRFA